MTAAKKEVDVKINVHEISREATRLANADNTNAEWVLLYDKHFARLVIEECAKVCDARGLRNFPWGSENSDRYHACADMAEALAAAIRARKP